jgi:hypothetical protein
VLSWNQIYFFRLGFVVLESEVFRAFGAQPEVLDMIFGSLKTVKSAAIKTHQQLGAFRVSAFRNHSYL